MKPYTLKMMKSENNAWKCLTGGRNDSPPGITALLFRERAVMTACHKMGSNG